MRSVADDLRRDARRSLAALTIEERIALALRLGDDDVTLFCAVHRVEESLGRVRLAQARRSGRRPSVANQPGRR
jgi:hypothetical protein